MRFGVVTGTSTDRSAKRAGASAFDAPALTDESTARVEDDRPFAGGTASRETDVDMMRGAEAELGGSSKAIGVTPKAGPPIESAIDQRTSTANQVDKDPKPAPVVEVIRGTPPRLDIAPVRRASVRSVDDWREMRIRIAVSGSGALRTSRVRKGG